MRRARGHAHGDADVARVWERCSDLVIQLDPKVVVVERNDSVVDDAVERDTLKLPESGRGGGDALSKRIVCGLENYVERSSVGIGVLLVGVRVAKLVEKAG